MRFKLRFVTSTCGFFTVNAGQLQKVTSSAVHMRWIRWLRIQCGLRWRKNINSNLNPSKYFAHLSHFTWKAQNCIVFEGGEGGREGGRFTFSVLNNTLWVHIETLSGHNFIGVLNFYHPQCDQKYGEKSWGQLKCLFYWNLWMGGRANLVCVTIYKWVSCVSVSLKGSNMQRGFIIDMFHWCQYFFLLGFGKYIKTVFHSIIILLNPKTHVFNNTDIIFQEYDDFNLSPNIKKGMIYI